MKFKRKFILLILLIALIALAVYVLPGFIPGYDTYFFYPFQSLRMILWGWLPVSLGDILYILGGAVLLITFGRWVYFILKFSTNKKKLAASVLNTINTTLFVYLFFIIGWGANYARPPLREYWGLQTPVMKDRAEKRRMDSIALVAFDQFLVNKLNASVTGYRTLSFFEINDRAKTYYRTYTNSKVKMHGQGIKYSLFGYFMERMAIDGYYNPFTGEGQLNSNLPAFMMPFIICHEMAHQAGIAAEGDANLMAYALGTTADDISFNYSSYLNIWLYTNNRLYRRDSVLAKKMEQQLNKLTTAHIDTLEELSKKYNNEAAVYGTELYDNYLKMQNQKEGIHSYGNVSSSAWQLELQRMSGKGKLISVP